MGDDGDQLVGNLSCFSQSELGPARAESIGPLKPVQYILHVRPNLALAVAICKTQSLEHSDHEKTHAYRMFRIVWKGNLLVIELEH